jgi:hypothetical protein
MKELSIIEALCIIHSGISNNDERELYDEASDVVMKEGKRLKLIYKRELINLELTKEIETELSNKKQGYSEEDMIITITNKDGLNQISKFSENKIKHITETNQWGYVINTILKNSNKQDMKQSVVECLEDKLNQIKSSSTDMNGTIKFLETEFKELFEHAKEMENQQKGYGIN